MSRGSLPGFLVAVLACGACFNAVPDGSDEVADGGGQSFVSDAGAVLVDAGAPRDAGNPLDGSVDGFNAGLTDAGLTDAGLTDAGLTDAGLTDAGLSDAGPSDGGSVADGGASADAGGLGPDAGSATDAGAQLDGGGHLDAGLPTCGPIVGRWARVDGFFFDFTAVGCLVNGIGDNSQYFHRLQGTFNVVSGQLPFVIARTTIGSTCVVQMYGFIQLTDPTHFTLVLTGSSGGCGLTTNLTDVQFYERL